MNWMLEADDYPWVRNLIARQIYHNKLEKLLSSCLHAVIVKQQGTI
jgi:hypothetical protein